MNKIYFASAFVFYSKITEAEFQNIPLMLFDRIFIFLLDFLM